MSARIHNDEIPSDEDVIAAIGAGSASPTAVLQKLMDSDHTRAASQRAMQRALDRQKIEFDLDLNFVAVRITEDA